MLSGCALTCLVGVDDLPAAKKISPVLHHPASGSQVFGGIVSPTHFVFLRMRELKLDPILMVFPDPYGWLAELDQLLIGSGACQTPEAVNSLAAMVSEAIEGVDHRVF